MLFSYTTHAYTHSHTLTHTHTRTHSHTHAYTHTQPYHVLIDTDNEEELTSESLRAKIQENRYVQT